MKSSRLGKGFWGVWRTGVRLGAAGLAATAVLVAAPAAEACGGLFCSAAAPVNQTAERILFAQGEETTTQIVEILYEGPSERFAWVLPVPGVPEIEVSSSEVFDRLQQQTNPRYVLNSTFPNCDAAGFGASSATGGSVAAAGGTTGSQPSTPTVTVVDAGSVGPFDYETIAVDAADQDPADVAIRWLDDNGYDVGALGPDVLRPYLENGLNLIAVRLQKGVDSGSIQPLSLTFRGMQPSIPIRPTAVAANDDMGILVWILGPDRAVPTNYKGLELNEALIDWTNPGPTYDAVVSAAADEAEGQGFVTEFAGDSEVVSQVFKDEFDTLQTYEGYPLQEVLLDLALRYGTLDGFVRAFDAHVDFRDELTAEDFVACPSCYLEPTYYVGFGPVDYGSEFDSETDPLMSTDLDALRTAVDEQVLLPLRNAGALIRQYPYLTRLYTTMSASEMTVDPVFDFNSDLEDVSNLHQATREFLDCGTAWVVILPDGTRIESANGAWPLSPSNPGGMPFTSRILSFTAAGPGVVTTDNTDLIDQAMAEMPEVNPAGGGAAGSGSGGTSAVGPGVDGDGGGRKIPPSGFCVVGWTSAGSRSAAILSLGILLLLTLFRRRSSRVPNPS